MSELKIKLEKLPKTPGVYFYKNKSGVIIYIGKAANLRSRVRQYFQKSRAFDPKTDALLAEITDVDWQELETELDALFVEAEMIRRYMPKYNILLRDDKSFVYVRIDINSNYPSVTFTRRPLDDGAKYFGPYQSKFTINRALRHLRRIFPYSTHPPTNIPARACLQAQIGLCPGLEAGMTGIDDYRKNLRRLIRYMTGKRKKLTKDFEKQMNTYAKTAEFEKAADARNKLLALKNLDNKTIFGDVENLDISKDKGLVEIAQMLGIGTPRRIEGFDISHMSGMDTVASMVVFNAGVPDKSQYRKFKSRVRGNDDYAHMREVMLRRFSEANIKKWGKPDLILIDGGKGQVASAAVVLDGLKLDIPLIGLAKRLEEIIIPARLIAKDLQKDTNITRVNNDSQPINKVIAKDLQYESRLLSRSSDALKLLQRIRDESHRFAISYHSTLKRARQTGSLLDDIPGIGNVYKRKLIKSFGSTRGVKNASLAELKDVVGEKRARLVKEFIG
ncbi:MAG TPA: excinuclease ABC subunit UvrC [Candidatus Saccharimonadales bacterium]|nr:excinuclease ABC subunit UvrC [Candidatus Saccharimonadales bacterium]